MRLAGKTAIVTGAASGFGEGIARKFVAEGAKVIVADRDGEGAARAAKALGDAAFGLRADVTLAADVKAMFEAAQSRFGGLDILINNAGIAGPTAPIDQVSTAEWKRTIDVNLTGQFYCARRAVPLLRETAGVMLNMSSVAGRLGYANRTPYAASKWAVVGLSASLAKGGYGIRVNALLPGIVEGPRIEKVIADRAQVTGKGVGDVRAFYLENVSLNRMVSPHDVANMAVFLCSPLGRNISGQAISVDGNVVNI